MGKELKTRGREERKGRSLSRSPRDSRTRVSERSPSQPKSPGKSGSNSKRPSRPKGFQKLFSIRDLRSEGDIGLAVASKPPPLVFKREDADSSWAPRTPSNSQRARPAVDDMLMTPPPPLAPHSPLKSDHGFRSTDDDRTNSSSRRARRLSASAADLQDDDRSVEESSTSQRSDGKRRHSSHVRQPVSILKNRIEESPQTSGDFTTERDPGRQMDPGPSYDAIQECEAGMDTEEDVFSHYTWANDDVATCEDPEQTREERMRLKESIRESLLYSAFEAIEGVL